jgi:serine/threonine protein kinase
MYSQAMADEGINEWTVASTVHSKYRCDCLVRVDDYQKLDTGDHILILPKYNATSDILLHCPIRPPPETIALLVFSMLAALIALWYCGYVHMDIKPYNIMLAARDPDAEARFVLIDLGSCTP